MEFEYFETEAKDKDGSNLQLQSSNTLPRAVELSRLESAPQGSHWKNGVLGKSSESVQCAITGPCLRMSHRPSA